MKHQQPARPTAVADLTNALEAEREQTPAAGRQKLSQGSGPFTVFTLQLKWCLIADLLANENINS